MLKKITLISLFVGLLVGCGDKESSQVKVVSSSADEGKQQLEEQKAITAIYLPGGAGLDFGKKPVAVTESKWKNKDVIAYIYEFEDSSYEMLDGAISEILLGDGYVRTEANDPRLIKYTEYKKNGAVIGISYANNVREGFTKNISLKIWWVK